MDDRKAGTKQSNDPDRQRVSERVDWDLQRLSLVSYLVDTARQMVPGAKVSFFCDRRGRIKSQLEGRKQGRGQKSVNATMIQDASVRRLEESGEVKKGRDDRQTKSTKSCCSPFRCPHSPKTPRSECPPSRCSQGGRLRAATGKNTIFLQISSIIYLHITVLPTILPHGLSGDEYRLPSKAHQAT